MDLKADVGANHYGAIQRDEMDPDFDFGFEDIRLYVEDWDAPDFFVQVFSRPTQ